MVIPENMKGKNQGRKEEDGDKGILNHFSGEYMKHLIFSNYSISKLFAIFFCSYVRIFYLDIAFFIILLICFCMLGRRRGIQVVVSCWTICDAVNMVIWCDEICLAETYVNINMEALYAFNSFINFSLSYTVMLSLYGMDRFIRNNNHIYFELNTIDNGNFIEQTAWLLALRRAKRCLFNQDNF